MDAVQSLELLAEVPLKGGAVPDVVTIGVFTTAQLLDELFLDVLFPEHEPFGGSATGKCCLLMWS